MSTASNAYWVKWVDSTTHEGHQWRTPQELDSVTPSICEMVGFIYKATPEYILFVSCKNFDANEKDQELWGEMALPLGAILEMRPLRLGKAINPQKVKKDEAK